MSDGGDPQSKSRVAQACTEAQVLSEAAGWGKIRKSWDATEPLLAPPGSARQKMWPPLQELACTTTTTDFHQRKFKLPRYCSARKTDF